MKTDSKSVSSITDLNYEKLKKLLNSNWTMQRIEEDWLCGLSIKSLQELEDELIEKPLDTPTKEELNPYYQTAEDIVRCQKQIQQEENSYEQLQFLIQKHHQI